MKRFAELFTAIDETNRTNAKVAAIVDYFREAPEEDACWALWFLTGNRLKRLVKSGDLRQWMATLSGLPDWMLTECYTAVGDSAELLALILPEPEGESALPLHQLIEERLLPLRDWAEPVQFRLLSQTWNELGSRERFVFNKLLTGAFRMGVQKTLVSRALAQVAEVPPEVMAHRLMGPWEPSPEAYRQILRPDDGALNPSQPYPFFLAYPVEEAFPKKDRNQRDLDWAAALDLVLGPVKEWQAEWKYDGIRAQLLSRTGLRALWSRGEDLLTERFPEVMAAAQRLPDGVVLDGELLAWRDGQPLPFAVLQKRIGRKKLSPGILEAAPALFLVYDILEYKGNDLRKEPLAQRRRKLEEVLWHNLPDHPRLFAAETIGAESWSDLVAQQQTARERRVEGLMLKKRDSAYGVGRTKEGWWKWKVDPYTIDAVMVQAEAGHGRRAGLFTDYTFALWHEGTLMPVAKAYSGLTDDEIREVDRFIRNHTVSRHGPVRVVEPQMVFEVAFEGIQRSTRHKAGVAVRFPRIARIRPDKKADEADHLATLEALLPAEEEKAPAPGESQASSSAGQWRTADLFE